jgi:hypothetical protein
LDPLNVKFVYTRAMGDGLHPKKKNEREREKRCTFVLKQKYVECKTRGPSAHFISQLGRKSSLISILKFWYIQVPHLQDLRDWSP